MSKKNEWIFQLDDEDISFIKNFIIASGSLKKLASYYDVTYHIVRNRLNALIQKVKTSDKNEGDPYINYIKSLALEENYDYETAKKLIEKYKERVNDYIIVYLLLGIAFGLLEVYLVKNKLINKWLLPSIILIASIVVSIPFSVTFGASLILFQIVVLIGLYIEDLINHNKNDDVIK